MVKIWYMDDDTSSDQRLEHHRNPPELLSLEQLHKDTGVEYFYLDLATYETDGVLERLRKDRSYSYEDEIKCSPDHLPNYNEKIKSFYAEHLHTDDEIRFIVDGSGYFDVRDTKDRWIRIAVETGDLIIIPSGIYHRFTLDTKNYIHAKRYFVGEPVWTPINRPADELECRKDYLQKMSQGLPTVKC